MKKKRILIASIIFILIIMLMRFIGGLLVSLFVFAMFKYLRSGMSVIISCVLFIVLPLALVAFGVTNAQYMLSLIHIFGYTVIIR